jgi:hypothetical protein
MARHVSPVAAPPAGFIQGKDVDLSKWHGGEIAIDEGGRVHCIVGYRREDQPRDLPYYSPCVALHDRDGKSSHRFVELYRGTLQRTFFLRAESWYRLVDDYWLILPSGADSYFGVISRADRRENEPYTQAIFGGTFKEIEMVACALAPLAGRSYHEMLDLPRLTFSKTRDNRCDICNCLIPRAFPYLAFESAQYNWSHVSLHGFYRLLSFLCPTRIDSPVWKALRESGISEDLLTKFVENGDEIAQPLPARKNF